MKITFLGHAAFLITTDKGIRIITDPYKSGCFNNALSYKPIKESADIVLISHEHDDHNCVSEVLGKPNIIKTEGVWVEKDIKFTGISVYHDTQKGSARGKNIIFVIEADDLRITHLGDLGHTLSKTEYDKLGKIDILLIPVGGFFTIDRKVATEIMNQLNPKITIPMHYKTPSLDFPIVSVDEFIKDKKNVRKFNSAEVTISKDTLPKTPEIWVLKMAKC
ncbi:MAG: MBL fold metallo-hydrolase [candidate division WOR-3 bacterium]|nr:MBL fold metallo-hydrolase [candidate division WOR-3 bacterium]